MPVRVSVTLTVRVRVRVEGARDLERLRVRS